MNVRIMPSEIAIRNHWVDRLWERKGFDSPEEFLEPNLCFACGFEISESVKAERAHITPKCEGGSDSAENLHMLCWICHKDSEGLSGDEYWEWFWSRDVYAMLLSGAFRSGKCPAVANEAARKGLTSK